MDTAAACQQLSGDRPADQDELDLEKQLPSSITGQGGDIGTNEEQLVEDSERLDREKRSVEDSERLVEGLVAGVSAAGDGGEGRA